jgi:hypothetical protein
MLCKLLEGLALARSRRSRKLAARQHHFSTGTSFCSAALARALKLAKL